MSLPSLQQPPDPETIFGFDTRNPDVATAALLVYVVWRSRDKRRFRIDFDVWARVARFVKDCAARSRSTAAFAEQLMPRLACGQMRPRWMAVGAGGGSTLIAVRTETGGFSHAFELRDEDRRTFMTKVFDSPRQREILKALRDETAWVIACVQDRLEREKPVEAITTDIEEIDDEDA